MRSYSAVFAFLLLISPCFGASAETELPSYDDAMEDSPSVENELGDAEPEEGLESGQVLDGYGTFSDAMDELSLQDGDVVTAPDEDLVPFEEEIPEDGLQYEAE